MAVATANCTCKTCGEVFQKTATCFNRRCADEWEAWAAMYYDQCPSCWAKEQREKEKATGLLLTIRFGFAYEVAQGSAREVFLICEGDTMPYKDKIKTMGALWTDDYPNKSDQFAGGLFPGFGKPPCKRWVFSCKAVHLPEVVEHIQKELPVTVKEYPTPENISVWQRLVAQYQELEKQRDEPSSGLQTTPQLSNPPIFEPRPVWPEELQSFWPEKDRWNGNFYGKEGDWRVYLNGVETHSTNQQKVVAEEAHKAFVEWQERRGSY